MDYQELDAKVAEHFADTEYALRVLTAAVASLIATHTDKAKVGADYRHLLASTADLPKYRGVRTGRVLDAIDRALQP